MPITNYAYIGKVRVFDDEDALRQVRKTLSSEDTSVSTISDTVNPFDRNDSDARRLKYKDAGLVVAYRIDDLNAQVGENPCIRMRLPDGLLLESKDDTRRKEFILSPGLHILVGMPKSGKTSLLRIISSCLREAKIVNGTGKSEQDYFPSCATLIAGEPFGNVSFDPISLVQDCWDGELKDKDVVFIDSISDLTDWALLGNPGAGAVPKSMRQYLSLLNDVCFTRNIFMFATFNIGSDPKVLRSVYDITRGATASSWLIRDGAKIDEIDSRVPIKDSFLEVVTGYRTMSTDLASKFHSDGLFIDLRLKTLDHVNKQLDRMELDPTIQNVSGIDREQISAKDKTRQNLGDASNFADLIREERAKQAAQEKENNKSESK